MSETENKTGETVTNGRRERRLRFAAILILSGLAIEFFSLRWTHPTAFLVFAAGTGLCVGIGVLLFLATLFSTGPMPKP